MTKTSQSWQKQKQNNKLTHSRSWQFQKYKIKKFKLLLITVKLETEA
jgi:hypothetical protein